MSKLHHRKFARFFPAYHPKAGQPTYSVEKIHYAIWGMVSDKWMDAQAMLKDLNKHLPSKLINNFINSLDMEFDFSKIKKNHTIRAGHHIKAGDFIRPSVWSGKPYASKQIIIGPNIEIKKTWDFEVDACGVIALALPGEQLKYLDEGVDEIIARNDGLEYDDFLEWIVMPFYRKGKDSGPMQIICWNENVEY